MNRQKIYRNLGLLCVFFLFGCHPVPEPSEIKIEPEIVKEDVRKTVTVRGKLIPTKDGAYIGEYVIPRATIQKYNLNYADPDIEIEVTGKVTEFEIPCEDEDGNILQCRKGVTRYLEEIEDVRIVED